MQKNTPRRHRHYEWLNKSFGYFYTVNKTIEKLRTRFQNLELVDTNEFGRVLMLDGITQVSEKTEFQYHETMVHPALCGHGAARTVLIIGAGDGGIAREVLKYPSVKEVVLVELDRGVVDFSKKHLSAMNQRAFADRRLHVRIGDGRAFVRQHPRTFDAVIMDMTDPFGPSKMLYTRNFFQQARAALRNGRGVFVMHTESPVTRPATFTSIQATLRQVFKQVCPLYLYVQMYATLWSITVVSDRCNIARRSPQAIDALLARNGIQVPYPYISALLRRKAHIITDRHPDIPDTVIHT